MAALIQQVLAKTRLGVERVIERAHQHQYADALTALYPAFFHQLVDGAAQGVAIYLESAPPAAARREDSRRSGSVDEAPAQVLRLSPDSVSGSWSDV